MPITINGSGTVTGISVGGLPDGIVDTDMLANSAVTSAKSSGLGISEADVWRLTAGNTGDQTPISANWARNNEAGTSLLGTGMSESSGVFTFPSTGHWFVPVSYTHLTLPTILLV